MLAVLAVVGLVILVAGLLLYVNRRAAAREMLVGWLDDRGVAADVQVERVELDGFVGRIRIGDPSDPDVIVERVEVDYVLGMPWSKGGMGLTPRRVRLIRPVLKARWADGKFSLGSLDPLIEDFTSRPPRPDSSAPLVLVEGGRLRLTTEYGPLDVLADARIADNKLMRLSARMPAAALQSGEVSASVRRAALDVVTTGDRTAVQLSAVLDRLATPSVTMQTAVLEVKGDLPYPDFKARRGEGAVRLDGSLVAGRARSAGFDAAGLRTTFGFVGSSSGWIDAFRLIGRTDVAMTAGRLSGNDIAARDAAVRLNQAQITVARTGRGLEWDLAAPATARAAALKAAAMDLAGLSLRTGRLSANGRNGAFTAAGPISVATDRFTFGDLALSGVTGAMALDLAHDQTTTITTTGGLTAASGAWPLFGPTGRDDPADLVAMKSALGRFRLSAPGLRIRSGAPGLEVALTQPVRLAPANGGVLTVSGVGSPVYRAAPGQLGGGAFVLAASRGRGLPEARFDVTRWGLTRDGFTAELNGRAGLDFDLARGVGVTTRGTLTSGGGRLTYTARTCSAVTVARLELGENDAVDVAGNLCPSGGPLVRVADGAWRVTGGLGQVSADVPFLGARISQAGGAIIADGGPRGLGLDVRLDQAGVSDTQTPRRFNPLTAEGRAALIDERWTGAFDLAVQGRPLGRVALAHDGAIQSGGLVIEAPDLAFTAEGLQPDQITPLTDGFLTSPVEGSAAFNGRFDWTPAGVTSSGVASTAGLDFVSPLGPVKGLKGVVAFTSLTPLVTAPGQTLTIDSIAAFAPLSDAGLSFELGEGSARIASGRFTVGGGSVSIEPFDVPFDRSTAITGVIVLDRVQLGDLIGATGFADKVSMDAVVSGRLPFVSDQNGVRITGGSLAAVEPGRLSIQREALVGLQAGGGGEVSPNTVQDLAYQAMENLSFDTLSAEVNSLDQGRLGVVFHIKGRHDPPVRQELRLTLAELISRDFLNRELPLPSGTGIDLTLDTTLNINQLLSDLMSLNRARRGEAEPAEPER